MLLVLVLALGERPPDRVLLKDGTTAVGRAVVDDEREVVLRQGSRERSIPRAEIQAAHTRLSAWREAFARWDILEKEKNEDPTRTADLAVYCRRAGLPEEARVFALRAVADDPDQALARDLLGDERAEKGWFSRDAGRRLPWKELLRRRESFPDGWRLETTHWRLQTNLPLREAACAILDLECAYREFQALVGRELRAVDVEGPLDARVYADSTSYPEVAAGRGYFDPRERVLHVDASLGLDRGLLVHEATHQLLDAVLVAQKKGRGELPAWLNEGLAEYLRATLRGGPGHLVHDPDALDAVAFRQHALAREPYELARVLRFDASDFLASSRQDLKYAQSYTFVHFAMQAEGNRWRPALFEVLRNAAVGRVSVEDVERAFGARVEALASVWTDWVALRAR